LLDSCRFKTDDFFGSTTATVVFGAVNVDFFWTQLQSFHDAGFLMGVATAVGGQGLVGRHAYSLLDVLEIPNVTCWGAANSD